MRPNLIVIGAMKCGTTSLHHYLGLHPDVFMSREKELRFFTTEFNWHRGVAWYESHFPVGKEVRGESSPAYTNPSFKGVPERMHSIVPHARLILIVRDPLERIVSHYVDLYATRKEDRTLADALADLHDNLYLVRSRYYSLLEPYLRYYAKSRILILSLEDLHLHPSETMRQAFQFLEVDPNFDSPEFSVIKHESSEKRRLGRVGHLLARMGGLRLVECLPPDLREKARLLLSRPFSRKMERPFLDGDLRRRVTDHLRDDIERFKEFCGRDFEGWSM